MFVGNKVIVISYVDDLLLYSPRDEWINDTINALKDKGVDLNREGDANGFLGVDISRSICDNRITLTQRGLMDRIVTPLGLEDAKYETT